jgi:nucleotide-binding universal stress UspA family protein
VNGTLAAGRWLRFRRILLALDTASPDPAAVERVTALAARLRGELTALYVEDIDLVRLAEHGSINALSTVTAVTQQLASGYLRETLRLQAARMRRELERMAERRRIKCAFQVCQGRLVAEVLRAAGDDDLVVIGRSGGRSAPWVGSSLPVMVARALAQARARSVLLLCPGAPAGGRVLIAFDGSERAWHGLSIGTQIAELENAAVEVVLLAGRTDEAERGAADIHAALAESRLDVNVLHAPKATLSTLAGIGLRRRCGLLVLDANRALAEEEPGFRLLQRVPCSVLLVR